MNFNQTLEPFLKTDDSVLLEFIMFMLEDYPGIPEDWAKLLLERALESHESARIILSHTKNFPLTEDTITLLIKGIKRGGPVARYFKEPLSRITIGQAFRMKQEVKPLLPKALWKTFDFIVRVEDENDMWEEYAEVLSRLEGEESWELLEQAKRLADAFALKGWMDSQELYAVLSGEASYEEGNQIQHSPWGALASYMAAKLQIKEFIPLIADLLASENYLVQEEASDALIALQSDEVIDAVIPYLKNKDSIIYAVSVLANLKTERSPKALKEHYWHAELDEKELFFEGLCYSLSPQALPEIEDFIANGPDQMLVDYHLNLYGYYSVTGIKTPFIEEWRRILTDGESIEPDYGTGITIAAPKIEGKIGRNDPCPCGSGKKYKKCCSL